MISNHFYETQVYKWKTQDKSKQKIIVQFEAIKQEFPPSIGY